MEVNTITFINIFKLTVIDNIHTKIGFSSVFYSIISILQTSGIMPRIHTTAEFIILCISRMKNHYKVIGEKIILVISAYFMLD